MERYQEFRQRKFLCDIFFDIDGVERDLHRVILATKLENFIAAQSSCTKLGQNNGSCAENRLKLTNFPGGVQIFDIAVDFCYSPQNTLNRKHFNKNIDFSKYFPHKNTFYTIFDKI